MYESMFDELKKLAKQVNNLEVETKEAANNMELEVKKSLDNKASHIAHFIWEMKFLLQEANIPAGTHFQLSCCGDHWEGKPGACGSSCRSIGLEFYRPHYFSTKTDISVWFGRWFTGFGTIDRILDVTLTGVWKSSKTSSLQNIDTIARTLRENILTRWNEDTERAIADQLFAKLKVHLRDRTEKATENLRNANERYEKFCKKE